MGKGESDEKCVKKKAAIFFGSPNKKQREIILGYQSG
jgi:hypothetical protein